MLKGGSCGPSRTFLQGNLPDQPAIERGLDACPLERNPECAMLWHQLASAMSFCVLCRARNGITDAQVSVDVCVFLFDLLFLDGEGMLQSSFRQRRQALSDLFVNLRPGYVEMANGFELEVSGGGADDKDPRVSVTDLSEKQMGQTIETEEPTAAPKLELDEVIESTDAALGTIKRQCGVSARHEVAYGF